QDTADGGHPRSAREWVTGRGISVNRNLSRPAVPWKELTLFGAGYQHRFVMSACRMDLTFSLWSPALDLRGAFGSVVRWRVPSIQGNCPVLAQLPKSIARAF